MKSAWGVDGQRVVVLRFREGSGVVPQIRSLHSWAVNLWYWNGRRVKPKAYVSEVDYIEKRDMTMNTLSYITRHFTCFYNLA